MSIRVMVVDDSVVVRRAVADALNSHDEITVVATAVDGQVALRKIADLTPEVVILDIEMPVLDGLETLVQIRSRWPEIAVIMFSTLTERNASVSLEALSLGAVDYATKPTRLASRVAATAHVMQHVLPKVLLWGKHAPGRRAASGGATVKTPSQSYRTEGYGVRRAAPGSTAAAGGSSPVPSAGSAGSAGAPWTTIAPGTRPVELIVIGSSTGGPDALARLLPTLSAQLPVPVVIVQHMPPVFTAMLAKRLHATCTLPVSESVDGAELKAGHIYIAAGGMHLEVRRDRHLLRSAHTDAAHENSCRPAVDVMFRTAAKATKGGLLGAVLTGMGQDGLLGARAIVEAGGSVVAQDEASSVVWGMPGFVARAGIASAVLSLDDLSGPLNRVHPPTLMAGATP